MSIMEPVGKKKTRRARREFTAEFKAQIVEACQRGDRTIAQVVADFDLVDSAVRRWIAQADADADPAASHVPAVLDQVRQIQRCVRLPGATPAVEHLMVSRMQHRRQRASDHERARQRMPVNAFRPSRIASSAWLKCVFHARTECRSTRLSDACVVSAA
jgi:transposase